MGVEPAGIGYNPGTGDIQIVDGLGFVGGHEGFAVDEEFVGEAINQPLFAVAVHLHFKSVGGEVGPEGTLLVYFTH